MSSNMIGGFRILEEIHGGGQGKIVRAVCETPPFDGIEPGTVVALKVMPVVHDEGGLHWIRLLERTNALTKLSHPSVVKYYGCFREHGTVNENHVIVQECLEGDTLKQRLDRFPQGLDADEALRITESAIAGLEYAAANGIVHQDVKPGNIFLCKDGGVKLIDFELAFLVDGSTVTITRKLAGTYDYMAPEFMTGGFGGDERSDVFSMGVVMHEVITGRKPYQRSESGERKEMMSAFISRWANLHTDDTNPIQISPRANRLLAHSREVLANALAPFPQDRYQSFTEFHEGLKSIRYRDLKNGDKMYRILQVISNGGFGEVFKAKELRANELVAIKHLLKDAYAERFHREAKIVVRLHDPHLVRFIEFFEKEHAGTREAFIVMEYLSGMPGSTLRDAIKSANGSKLPWREIFAAFACYAHALATFHEQGIIHRNIKPSNLYFPKGHPENAVIMDFTIARDVNGTQTTGQVPGTPDYMPPEVILADSRGDQGMDIYALGLSLYEALTGTTAYPRLPQGPSALMELLMRGKNNVQPSFDSPLVVARPKLLALLKDMTNIDPELRIKDAVEVERRIGEIIKDDLLFLNESITLDGDSHTIDFLDEPFSVCPSYDDDMRGLGPFPEEELRELQEKARRLKRRNVKVSLLVGLLVTAACCTLFWWGRSNALGYRVLVDVLVVVWLSLLCTIDLKTRRLPNVLTLGGLALWLSLGFASEGATGLLACGRAAGIGFLFLLVPFFMKSVGGGLVKMMAACCAYVGWGRLLPFGVLYIVSGMIMGGSVWMDRFANRATDKNRANILGSPILAVATLAVIILKWIGWIA